MNPVRGPTDVDLALGWIIATILSPIALLIVLWLTE